MAGIFISYRRDDSAGHAGRLYDRLSDHFGPDQVFMDVDAIKPGQDFVDAVRQAVGGCDGLVAIIGREWLTISDATGARRLDDPEDLVRLEIATALGLGIRVVPVLVQGAQMPGAAEFPDGIKELARRNAQEISDRSFRSDVERLIEALEAPDPERAGGTAFVGREREFVEFRTALEGALAGHGRLAMLTGEPGIGKTRMAQELASHAERQGAQILWGWCYEQVGAPPYWPWVDSVRSYISLMEPEQLRSLMGPGAADICEVIPDLREKIPGLEPPPALDPDQARFRLFDSFANFFINAAQVQPLMLVLEDLQWADKPSLLLLEFLTRRLADSRFMVLGTYRDAEVTQETPLFESLAQLRRSPMFLSRVLEGLESGQVGSFIREAGGGEASQELIDAIYAHTEGNPFFISEVIRLLVERGQLEEVSGSIGPVTLGIPQGVLEVVGQRLNRLSAECHEVLTSIAFAGRQFEFKLLELLNEQTPSIQLLDLVDEALEARVIEEVPDERDRYQFIHALMQQTLLEGLSTSRKVRTHARIGEGLETLYGERIGEHAAELAYHFSEGAMVSGTDKLVYYAGMAGERALESYAWEDALAHFQNGLTAMAIDLDESTPAPNEESAALFFGLGRSQAALVDNRAFQSLRRSLDYYASSGDIEKVVAIAELSDYSSARTIGLQQLIAPALQLVPAGSLHSGRLLSRYGQIIGLQEGAYDEAIDSLNQALEIAQREKDEALEVHSLAALTSVYSNHMRYDKTLESGLRVIELTKGVHDLRSEVSAHYFVATCLIEKGDLMGASQHSSEMLQKAERLGDRFWLEGAYWKSEIAMRLAGDWERARSFANRALEIGSRPSNIFSGLAMLGHELGDLHQGDSQLESLIRIAGEGTTGSNFMNLSASARVALTTPIVAKITGVTDHLESATRAARFVLENTQATALSIGQSNAGLAFIAVLSGDADLAAKQYDIIKDWGNTFIFFCMSADRLIGLVADTMGQIDQAIRHFEDALTFCRNGGYKPELGWVCCDYADVLLDRSGEGDRIRAISLLDESLAISTELGMRPLMERLLDRQGNLKA